MVAGQRGEIHSKSHAKLGSTDGGYPPVQKLGVTDRTSTWMHTHLLYLVLSRRHESQTVHARRMAHFLRQGVGMMAR